MKNLFVVCVCAVCFLLSCQSPDNSSNSTYGFEYPISEKVAESYGVFIGANFKRQFIEGVNLAEFEKGFKIALEEKDESLVRTAYMALSEYFTGVQQQQKAQYDAAVAKDSTVKTTFQPDPVTLSDSISYFYGIWESNKLVSQQKGHIDADLVLKGVKAQMASGDTVALKTAIEHLRTYDSLRTKHVQQMNEQYLTENGKKPGVVTLPSGVQYEVLTKGEGGAKPQVTDEVKVHYAGQLINGDEFDSSIKRGEPTVFGIQKVIRGWQEALQLMSVGDKWRVVIPQNLGYGERGTQGIPGYSTLIFEVELLDVMPAQ